MGNESSPATDYFVKLKEEVLEAENKDEISNIYNELLEKIYHGMDLAEESENEKLFVSYITLQARVMLRSGNKSLIREAQPLIENARLFADTWGFEDLDRELDEVEFQYVSGIKAKKREKNIKKNTQSKISNEMKAEKEVTPTPTPTPLVKSSISTPSIQEISEKSITVQDTGLDEMNLVDDAIQYLQDAKKLQAEGKFQEAITKIYAAATPLVDSGIWGEKELENAQTEVARLKSLIELEKKGVTGKKKPSSIELGSSPEIIKEPPSNVIAETPFTTSVESSQFFSSAESALDEFDINEIPIDDEAMALDDALNFQPDGIDLELPPEIKAAIGSPAKEHSQKDPLLEDFNIDDIPMDEDAQALGDALSFQPENEQIKRISDTSVKLSQIPVISKSQENNVPKSSPETKRAKLERLDDFSMEDFAIPLPPVRKPSVSKPVEMYTEKGVVTSSDLVPKVQKDVKNVSPPPPPGQMNAPPPPPGQNQLPIKPHSRPNITNISVKPISTIEIPADIGIPHQKNESEHHIHPPSQIEIASPPVPPPPVHHTTPKSIPPSPQKPPVSSDSVKSIDSHSIPTQPNPSPLNDEIHTTMERSEIPQDLSASQITLGSPGDGVFNLDDPLSLLKRKVRKQDIGFQEVKRNSSFFGVQKNELDISEEESASSKAEIYSLFSNIQEHTEQDNSNKTQKDSEEKISKDNLKALAQRRRVNKRKSNSEICPMCGKSAKDCTCGYMKAKK